MCHGDYAFWTQLYVFLAASYIGYPFLAIDLGAFSAKISSRYFLCLKFFVSALFSFSWILKFSFFIRFQSSWRLCSFLLTSFPLLPSEWNIALILLLSLGAVGLSQVCPYWSLSITVIWHLFFLHLEPRIWDCLGDGFFRYMACSASELCGCPVTAVAKSQRLSSFLLWNRVGSSCS